MKELTKEQKGYIREADNAVNFLEEQVEEMGSYGHTKQAEQIAVNVIKDFITWSLNNIREPESTCNELEDWKTCPRCLEIEAERAGKNNLTKG